MIVRRLVARGLARTGSTEEDPRRRRAKRYLLIVFSAGTISGLAALIGLGPFGDLQVLINDWVYGGPAAINASAVFPTPAPTHRTVDVYDPAPVSRPTSQPTTQPTVRPTSSPTRRPRSSPSPSLTPRPTPSPD